MSSAQGGTNTLGEPESSSRKMWRSAGSSAAARMLVVPISAVLGIFTTRLIIDDYGPSAYAQYGLLVALGSLLPFADLGISAVLMNVIGESPEPERDARVQRVLTTAIRVLLSSASVIVLLAVAMTLFDLWPAILGGGLIPGAGSLVAGMCLAVIGLTLPLGIGQRILAASERNHISIIIMGVQAPLVLLTVFAMSRLGGGDGGYLAVIPYLAMFLLSAVAVVVAARKLSPNFSLASSDVFRFKSAPGVKVFDVAWPMLIQMIALPLAMQTDRIVLSHVSSVTSLAEYNLAAQMFTPIWTVTSAAGLALWPIYARARAGSVTATSPKRVALAFGALGGGVSVVIGLCSGWLSELATGGQITLGVPLVIAFSVLMVFQSAKVPLGMYMTDRRGLRYQALMIVLMLPVNLGLSWVLARSYGALGPVVGSCVGVFIFQVIANWLFVSRVRRGSVASDRASTVTDGTT